MAKLDKSDLKKMIKKSRILFKGGELPKVHGYEGEVEPLVIREKGDVWTDKDGKEWKQVGVHNKVRTDTMFDKLRKELRTARNCPKEICSIDTTKYLDKRMNAMKGMCFDCVQDYEQKLKDAGKYEAYEKKTLLENERSFLCETKSKLVESKDHIKNDPRFLNEDGSLEPWSIPNKSKLMGDLETDLEELESRLQQVESWLLEYAEIEF